MTHDDEHLLLREQAALHLRALKGMRVLLDADLDEASLRAALRALLDLALPEQVEQREVDMM